MKVYKYIKEIIKNIVSHQSFQFFLRWWNLDQMIFKCSLIHYGVMIMIMTMLMIMIFLG
jgi:hypothetical protein